MALTGSQTRKLIKPYMQICRLLTFVNVSCQLRATLINEDRHILIRRLKIQWDRRWPPINIFVPDQRQAFEPWNWFVKSSIPGGSIARSWKHASPFIQTVWPAFLDVFSRLEAKKKLTWLKLLAFQKKKLHQAINTFKITFSRPYEVCPV